MVICWWHHYGNCLNCVIFWTRNPPLSSHVDFLWTCFRRSINSSKWRASIGSLIECASLCLSNEAYLTPTLGSESLQVGFVYSLFSSPESNSFSYESIVSYQVGSYFEIACPSSWSANKLCISSFSNVSSLFGKKLLIYSSVVQDLFQSTYLDRRKVLTHLCMNWLINIRRLLWVLNCDIDFRDLISIS